jgi:hypothetical protein
MLGLGRQAVNTVSMAFAAALDIGLDFLLIPDHGAIGAANRQRVRADSRRRADDHLRADWRFAAHT